MIYFLIPVYNEEGNIVSLAENLLNVLPGEEVFWVFSDDGSSDKSIELLEKNFPKSNTRILSDGKNHGPGAAFNTGFNWILEHSENNTDIIITLEADNTSDHKIIPEILSICRLNFDLVLASVYSQGGGFQKTSFMRKLLSACANIMMRTFFDMHVQTLSSFYRAYKIETLRGVKTKFGQIIAEPGFLCMIEVLMKCIRNNARVIEVPTVLLSERRKGKSKMKVLKTSLSYIRFMISRKY